MACHPPTTFGPRERDVLESAFVTCSYYPLKKLHASVLKTMFVETSRSEAALRAKEPLDLRIMRVGRAESLRVVRL